MGGRGAPARPTAHSRALANTRARTHTQSEYQPKLVRTGREEEAVVDGLRAALAAYADRAAASAHTPPSEPAPLQPAQQHKGAKAAAAMAAGGDESDVTPEGSPAKAPGRVGTAQRPGLSALEVIA